MALAMLIWSAVCIVTFIFSVQTGSRDYRTFFRHLLGPFWPAFEIVFFLGMIVILAVFAAAAGAIGQALFGWPVLAGSLMLIGSIAIFTTFGNESVERLFKYVSFFLYATYGVFLVLSLTHFGGRISSAFVANTSTAGWLTGGLSYAGYNVLGAVIILPVMRHLRSRKDAVVAGLLAGPLAMVPAILFFVSMTAFYPGIQTQILPSDFMLKQLNIPLLRLIFQAMIFSALLESGTGQIHAINERIARTYEASSRKVLSNRARLCITLTILIGSVFVANRIGLVALIANGYRWLSFASLAVFVLPLMTVGLWRVCRSQATSVTTVGLL